MTTNEVDIWHVENNHLTSLVLWRTDKDNFRVTVIGNYMALLTNHDYILIDKKYAELFSQLTDQVTLHEVKITDAVSKTTADNYIELVVKNKINPSSINSQDSTDLKVWKYDGSLFVSDRLKHKLQTIDKSELNFNPGFSHFG